MTQVENGSADAYGVDLTNCDREPIHHINSIQPIGFLIALSVELRISRVSSNISDFLGLPIEAMLDAPLRDVFRAEAIHTIRDRLAVLNSADTVERSFAVQLQADRPAYDLAIHRTGELIIIEAEPNIPAGDLNAGAMVRLMSARMKGQDNLVREAVRLVQALTGFDRVMIYRFLPDGSGEVIAERARPGLEPFLGLRYPAEDIPQQARALLLRNPVRILVDVDAPPSPLTPSSDGSSAPLDLSMSTLRTHSTMHIRFLENMGVGATMTVSLVCDGRLWGLISCHHMSARHVGFEYRTTAELFGEILSLMIEKRERAENAEYEAHTEQLRRQLIATVIERGSAAETVAQLADRLADLVPCDGSALYVEGSITLKGETPTAAECEAMRGFLADHAAGAIYATAELGRVYGPAHDFVDRAAGLLVLPLSRSAGDYLVFFRRETALAVTWAGRPGKLLEVGADGPRLSPRKSFAAWREVVRGKSALWTPAELSAAEKMRTTLLEIVLQRHGDEKADNRATTQKQELLIAELNHRVRNILGLIAGLIAQSRMSAQDVDTFATVLGDRVHALARAHDQITAKNWGPGSLATLIGTETAAFLGDGAARISAHGPAILLQPQAFSTIALVIHELMTNAAKHGALAGPSGQVAITWDLDADAKLILDWRETGGPPVSVPTRRGFGSTIIHRSIPFELGGEATLDFAPGGLHARFVLPPRHAVGGVETASSATIAEAVTPTGRLTGAVLLVEDNFIVALEGEDMLIALGAETVHVAGTVAEALRLLTVATPGFALLDVNLGIEMSWPIASRLRELGVPYVFATGYGDGIEMPLEHRHGPVLTKPYTKDSIARVLGDGHRTGIALGL